MSSPVLVLKVPNVLKTEAQLFSILKLLHQDTDDLNTCGHNIIKGVSETYSSTKSSKERIRVLSSVAMHLSNDKLKEQFQHVNNKGETVSCTSYEITQARLHCHKHGAAAAAHEQQMGCPKFKTPMEDLAFVVDFLHSPECIERSSYKTAPCSGKKASWLSELLGCGNQPVMYLKRNKQKLYFMYKE